MYHSRFHSTNQTHPNLLHTHSGRVSVGPTPTIQQQYSQGSVNPLKRETIQKHINIDSRFRQHYTQTSSSNFEVQLNAPIDNVVAMRILSAEIPNTFYNITTKNNYFYISDLTNTGMERIEIPVGQYTYEQFVNTLVSQYSDYFCIAEPTSNSHVHEAYEISYDENTGKVTIHRVDHTAFTLKFIDDANFDSSRNQQEVTKIRCDSSIQKRPARAREILTNCNQTQPVVVDPATQFQNIGYMLGFDQYEYTDLSGYTGTMPSNFQSTPYFYVAVNDYNQNYTQNMVSNQRDGIMSNNIISRYSFDPSSALNTYNRSSRYNAIFNSTRVYHGPVNIKRLRIQLIDEFGNILDTNGGNISLLIELETLYNGTM